MCRDILIIHKNSICLEPPTQMVLQTLTDLGYRVKLITLSVNAYWKSELERRRVEYYDMGAGNYLASNSRGLLFKLKTWWRYRRFVLKILEQQKNDCLLWFVDADSFAPLIYSNIFDRYRYVLHILETYDHSRFYRHVIGKYSSQCYRIVVCEEHRAAIFNVWFKLSSYPIVLPNKPYLLPSDREALEFVKSHSLKLYEAILNKKKIILYQGVISEDRNLITIVQAIKSLASKDFVFVIMGRDLGPLKKYMEILSDLIYIPQIPSPQHLFVTSIAYIGILVYDPISLNQIFCAPNKIFEYSGYNVPMIGNNIPGLFIPFERFKSGKVYDSKSVDSIQSAIMEVDLNIERYKKGASDLFNSVDVVSILQTILK
jgi:hypothetical protein